MSSTEIHGNGHETHAASCRLVVRKEKSLEEILQFVVSGLEAGQQVVAVAAPECLKEIAHGVGESGLKADSLARNGRLVLLAAPDCLSFLSKPDPCHRGPLRRNGSILRWVSDWSWAYGNGFHPDNLAELQHRLHEYVRSVTQLSLCTVDCEKLERTSLLAVLAEHRRAARGLAVV
jgi:MEDS: MEthanogen/methylotroph, DcmR Sensory domain